MKPLKSLISTYKADRLIFKTIYQKLETKYNYIYFHCIVINWYGLFTDYFIIDNLAVFVDLHILLVTLGSLIALSIPYVFLILYYGIIKYYANAVIFDKMKRLVIINGTGCNIYCMCHRIHHKTLWRFSINDFKYSYYFNYSYC